MEENSLNSKKNRHSWRKNPEDYSVTKKAGKLNSQSELFGDHEDQPEDLNELLQEREDLINELEEELQKAQFQNQELQEALTEAQTIIDQQQDQLSEFRRIAAQSQTDAEAFKMKNMFLNSESRSRDDDLHAVASACERLEAEVEALTWQVDQSKKMQIRLQNERDYLRRQLDDLSHTNGDNNHSNGTDTTDTNGKNNVNGNSYVDRHDTNGFTKSEAHLMELERAHEEIQQLQMQVEELQRKEAQWKNVSEDLVVKHQQLEQEKLHQATVIGQLQNELNSQMPVDDISVNHEITEATNMSATFQDINEERTRWKLYACSLVRSFVENCEEFIQKTPYQEPLFETLAERRWYTYAMQLLENILDVAPNRLTQMDLQLLKRSLSSRRPTAISPEINGHMSAEEPQILTSASFPQQPMNRAVNQPTRPERVARLASIPISEIGQSQ